MMCNLQGIAKLRAGTFNAPLDFLYLTSAKQLNGTVFFHDISEKKRLGISILPNAQISI
jgi:hypothetical protein